MSARHLKTQIQALENKIVRRIEDHELVSGHLERQSSHTHATLLLARAVCFVGHAILFTKSPVPTNE